MKSSPLGKGLSHLISEQFADDPTTAPIAAIEPNPFQPRKQFEEGALAELANSIAQFGILNPIVVRAIEGGKYQIIAGERRFRAAQIANLSEVPIRILEADSRASLEMALIENLQREDISPVEAAVAYQDLSDQFQLTQNDIADRVGMSRSAVANTMRLLKLPSAILDGLRSQQITEGHARALLALDSDPKKLATYKKITDEGLNVRQTEAICLGGQSKRKPKPQKSNIPSDLDHIEHSLSEKLGSPIKIDVTKNGSGRVVITFFSQDELERVLEKLEHIR